MIKSYKKEFLTILFILALKLVIITFLPLTGDEAYFIKWGNNPSLGYYDHPPMVGWSIYLLSFISDSFSFFRLFSFFTTLVVAFVIYKIATLYKVKSTKSLLLSLIFLASPIDILLSLMTNDIDLLLFGSLGTLFLLYSLERDGWLKYALLAGIFFGLAFLSKYFAIFLMLSLLIFSLAIYKSKSIKVILVVSLVVFLFIFQNLYFNYNSCWNNILFNFFARTSDTHYNIKTVVKYFLFILYIATPWGLYYLFKAKFEKNILFKLLATILSLIFVVFFIVSLKKSIGLHWFLLFTPYIFLLFSFIDSNNLSKIFTYNARFTYLHVVVILSIVFVPKSLFKEHKRYSDIVLFTEPQKVCKAFEKIDDKDIFTLGYSSASVLSYSCKRDIKVLFSNSKYGRFDDKLLDVRELDGKDLYIFGKKPFEIENIDAICQSFSSKKLTISGANFYLGECKNFGYEEYKKYYLEVQKKKFYNIPKWLPVGKCYFYDRYYR